VAPAPVVSVPVPPAPLMAAPLLLVPAPFVPAFPLVEFAPFVLGVVVFRLLFVSVPVPPAPLIAAPLLSPVPGVVEPFTPAPLLFVPAPFLFVFGVVVFMLLFVSVPVPPAPLIAAPLLSLAPVPFLLLLFVPFIPVPPFRVELFPAPVVELLLRQVEEPLAPLRCIRVVEPFMDEPEDPLLIDEPDPPLQLLEPFEE